MPALTRGRRGITLVELLVVLAIIAVLAGILMPVLRLSVIRSHKADETHAMRQIGIAKAIYDSDFDSDQISAVALASTGYLDPALLKCRRDRFNEGYGRWLYDRYLDQPTPEVSPHAGALRFSFYAINRTGDIGHADVAMKKMRATELRGLGWLMNPVDLDIADDFNALATPAHDGRGVYKRLLMDGSVKVQPVQTLYECNERHGVTSTQGQPLMFFFDRTQADLDYDRAEPEACNRAFVGDGGNPFF
jgi:prepilin-type N-terminal cleavage/methylation domain-containing protein